MSKKNNANEPYKAKGLVNKFIFFQIIMLVLFIESIFVLASLIKRGVYKKEVLSIKSKLGFDLIIKN